MRLACSEDSIAEVNEGTLTALREKHPAPHPDSNIPPVPVEGQGALEVTVEEVAKAIRSFPCGSAGGPDGLRPQHLKDMISQSAVVGGPLLLEALTSFINLVIDGKTPPPVRPFFFGASLIALDKKDGGVRPIAVGCTLRRLAAKSAGSCVMQDMGALLAPYQLGYGISQGAEAAAHAARIYLLNVQPDHLILKLDFKNAFNCLRRDKMLLAVGELAPQLLPLVHSAYCSPSSLYIGDETIQSSEGVQQGDPLGPLLFCLTIHGIVQRLRSEVHMFYLDDGTLGGSLDDILCDLQTVEHEAGELGLQLNRGKSEVICEDSNTREALLRSAPGLRVVSHDDATLLGSPIGSMESINRIICAKTASLQVMGNRLRHLHAHDAYCLLRNAFSIPKVLYTLRTSPCFLSSRLEEFDNLQRSILGDITNVYLDSNDLAWAQASLPVGSGGLGIRSVVQLAPSAFLASAAGSSDLIRQILPPRLRNMPYPAIDDALVSWSQGHGESPPPAPASSRQKAWDAPRVLAAYEAILNAAPDVTARARLLAATKKESGAWLHAFPVSSLGLRMDNDVIRIAMGLRLGVTLCHPHFCRLCGAKVDHLGTHGLSCRKSQGRHPRHAAINDLLKRSLASAKIPSHLEPTGISSSDGKRPDGITIVPWKSGRVLVWDATCPDTYAPSYVSLSTREAGAVADQAEQNKRQKYAHLAASYYFVPVAIETSGVMGPEALAFIRELGHRLKAETGEPRSLHFLLQRISVAMQRGNAAAVLGTSARSCLCS